MVKHFKVFGKRPFPIDMLRYDRCWPRTQEDSAKIDATLLGGGPKDYVVVELSTMNDEKPTNDRWMSFGWCTEKD
jgi:hypothetical protein